MSLDRSSLALPALTVVLAVLQVAVAASRQQPAQQPPTFRTSTELVSIEAHVIDRDGAPVEGLRAEDFEVFVDGRRRPLAHVQFVRSNAIAAGTGAAASPGHPFPGGRVVVLAVDQGSFPMSAQSSAREAAGLVMNSIGPEDYLGIVTFPNGAAIAPARDHAPVQQVVERIVGLRTDLVRSRFNISAVEASQLRAKDSFATQDLIARECRGAYPDPTCRQELIQDGGRVADALEQQAVLSINGLHGAIEAIGSLPGRKTMILISAGLPMRPGGVPNLDSETAAIARRAAAANINLYVFYMNVHFLRFFSAEYGKVNHTLYDDITMFGYGLEKFADVAGGSFAQVNVDADPFVARALRETSASYVLGVAVRPEDRDGKDHYIRVNVKGRGATVRYRKVVNIPRTQ
jgi:VWFA-related protein